MNSFFFIIYTVPLPSPQYTYRDIILLHDNQDLLGSKSDARHRRASLTSLEFNLMAPLWGKYLHLLHFAGPFRAHGHALPSAPSPRPPLPHADSQQCLQGTGWILQGVTQHPHSFVLQGIIYQGEKLQLLVMDENRGDVFAGFVRDVTFSQPTRETHVVEWCMHNRPWTTSWLLTPHLPVPDFVKARM